MSHRPFEDWLLEDQILTSEQQRELQAHLRDCSACTAIAESNLTLHSTRMASPTAGFVSRFEARLAGNRKVMRVQRSIGTLILMAGALVLLYWLVNPIIQELTHSPARWITTMIGYLLFILTSFRAISAAGLVMWHILPDFISPVGWSVIILMLTGSSVLWTFSVWRFTRIHQGAQP